MGADFSLGRSGCNQFLDQAPGDLLPLSVEDGSELRLDEQAEQIFVMTDDIAERTRKIGGHTLRSIGDISRHQRIKDAEDGSLLPRQMLSELRDDNAQLTGFLRSAHEVCARHNDVATTSLIEGWIDQTERRNWFLTEIVSDI